MPDLWRRTLAALFRTGPSRAETDLRTALTALAERWEQLAASAEKAIHLDGTYDPTRPAQGERIRTYRTAATDLRDVLRTGLVPHDLMTDAELDQHSTTMGDQS